MTRSFTPLTAAMLIALTPLSGVAFAETTKTPAAPTAPATPLGDGTGDDPVAHRLDRL